MKINYGKIIYHHHIMTYHGINNFSQSIALPQFSSAPLPLWPALLFQSAATTTVVTVLAAVKGKAWGEGERGRGVNNKSNEIK